MNAQRGITLPVVLIVIVVMMMGALSMVRSSSTGIIAVGNVAYEKNLSRLADGGIEAGFDWLNATASADKGLLEKNDAANGYASTYDFSLTHRSSSFWLNAKTITANGETIEYVIKRMCRNAGPYDDATQQCVQSAATEGATSTGVAAGSSLSSDAEAMLGSPMLHYVVTSRIVGGRGASVFNQALIMIGV